MTLGLAALLVAVVAAFAIGALLLVRRRAPAGGFFEDGDRAAGVFGVLATGFAVLLGFVVFLAFESFDTSRAGGEDEARIVAHQFETAQFMPADARASLAGQLICYARAVVHQEWPAMREGNRGEGASVWGAAMFHTLKSVEPRSASEQTAYDKWTDQRSDREDARADRQHGAEGVIPATLWIVLFLSAAMIFGYMLFFADSAERWYVQAAMIGSVAVVITSTLALLWFLDNPYHKGLSGLKPVAMERTLTFLDEERIAAVSGLRMPCDAQGVPRA
jgi:hypothetical protein